MFHAALTAANLEAGVPAVPITHFPPDSHEIIRQLSQQLRKVHTAMAGMAATDGRPAVPLSTEVYIPSQKMCIRYMP